MYVKPLEKGEPIKPGARHKQEALVMKLTVVLVASTLKWKMVYPHTAH